MKEENKRQAFDAIVRIVRALESTIGKGYFNSDMKSYIMEPYEKETDEYYKNMIRILVG